MRWAGFWFLVLVSGAHSLAIRPRVLFLDAASLAGAERLNQEGYDSQTLKVSDDDLDAMLSSKDSPPTIVIVSSSNTIRASTASSPALVAVGRAGVGVDNIDLDACNAAGVPVFNAPMASANAVAELTITLILALSRRLTESKASLDQGQWKRREMVGRTVKGKTLAIIGRGRIGRAVGELARALGLKVVSLRRKDGDSEEGMELLEDLDSLLKAADFLSVHVPLTAQTRGLIGARELALLRSSASVINTARAEVVDDAALLDALNRGGLSGAAVDVWTAEGEKTSADGSTKVWAAFDEPVLRSLASHPLVVATPHLGASTLECAEQIQLDIGECCMDLCEGRVPATMVGSDTDTDAALGSAWTKLGIS